MVKAKIADIKKELKEEQDEIYGDQDDSKAVDVEEKYEGTFGHKPIVGKPNTIADEVRGAEDSRRGKKAHKHNK